MPTTILHEVALGAFEKRLLDLEFGVPSGARPGEFGDYTIVIEVRTDHAENESRRA